MILYIKFFNIYMSDSYYHTISFKFISTKNNTTINIYFKFLYIIVITYQLYILILIQRELVIKISMYLTHLLK
jgi:hypothetical protein